MISWARHDCLFGWDGHAGILFGLTILRRHSTHRAFFWLLGRFRRAKGIFRWWTACVTGYIAMTIAVSLLTPQAIVSPTANDNWCFSVRSVTKTPLANAVVYKVDARISSDVNSTVRTSSNGASVYLIDAHGRHFSMSAEPPVRPFDIELDPGQSVNTSLTFLAAPDAQQLFLRIDWPGNRFVKVLVKFVIGNDRSLFHRPTLLRV